MYDEESMSPNDKGSRNQMYVHIPLKYYILFIKVLMGVTKKL